MQFANKTQFSFDPAPESFTATAVATAVYNTYSPFRETLGDLARLSFVRGKLKAKIELSAADTGTFTVKLVDGASNVIASGTVAIAAATRGAVTIHDIDLSALSAGLSGSSQLRVVVDVTAACTSATAKVHATLDVEHPIVIS